MQIEIKKFLKFLFIFSLAILLSGFIYNYFPDFWQIVKESGFFVASLVNSQNQKIQEETGMSVLQNLQGPFLREINKGQAPAEISQDDLDDLADQIDIIKAQIESLLAKKYNNITENEKNEKNKDKNNENKNENENENESKDDKEDNLDEDSEVVQENIETPKSSGTKTIYPKILISEVQIAGTENDKQEFVELFNLNDFDVDLTDWYLQRKTKTADSYSTYVSNNLFSGKLIKAKGFFIIARENNFNLSSVDIWTENPLTEDNSLVLKDPNRDFSDEFSWVNTSPPNGLSVGRKWDNISETEIQVLTPRQQNLKYIAPVIDPIMPPGNNFSKILISEILLGNDEFIELYNPNSMNVNLTDWYLQRKTKTVENYSSYVTKTQFEEKTILANNYFLVVRQGSRYEPSADIIFDEPLTADNSLVLKNSNGDISDKLGFGLATDFEILSAVTPEDGKALARKWLDSENSEQDTDNNFADFEIKTPTPKAKNIEPEPVDITPPSIIFNLLNTQTEINFSINFEITDLLETVSSGVASYIFRWKEGQADWQEATEQNFIANPVARDFIGEDSKTYYFQAKAKDKAENWSDWLPNPPVFTSVNIIDTVTPENLQIVINEIQIESEEKSHDFIEIYNPNDVEILLNEYRLVKRAKTSSSDTTIKSWGAEDKILPKQYYLWVSYTDEDYPALVGADIYTKQNISDNNGIAIRKGAEDTGEIIDAVGWGEFSNVLFEGSAFLTNPEKNKSISRIQGIDTNDNSKDFIILYTPTPKTE